jgi:hypothetical protein
LNDRYASKRDQFGELGKWAYNRVIQTGVGITLSPIPQAGPLELAPSGGTLAEGTYYAALAWVNAAGEEGAGSAPCAIEVTGGGGFTAHPPAEPAGVTGWNLYAGTAPDSLTLQNGTPITPGWPWQTQWILNSSRRISSGQSPSLTHAIPRILQRG